ncbi:MAG TPA: Hsp20/alpha crystallin family protein [bacterium]|nr:Hsp20/alpha crystallin family protein [bacterium]
MTQKMRVWSPFSDVWDLQDEMNRLFRSFGTGLTRREGEAGELSLWSPSVDIAEDKESVRITAELPGMKQADVKINVENGVLTLKGERKFSEETRKENYCRIERSYGAFSRSFSMPPTVETEKIQAVMKDGLLEVMIPKKEEAKPKEIQIEVK